MTVMQMRAHALAGGAHSALAVDQGLMSLVASLINLAGAKSICSEPAPVLDDRRLARAIDYIEASIEKPFTVGELADVACVSVFHFGRMFKQATGQTAHRYVMHKRVERAKDVLLNTDLDLVAIAIMCGFASQSHLSECFRKATGAPPGKWRSDNCH